MTATAGEVREEICVGQVEAVPPGEGRRFHLGDAEIAVFRGRDGSLYAVEDRCPHRGAPLSDGIFGAGQVICPYHSYRFNLADGSCASDSTCHLRTYPVREERGLLLITLE